MSPGRRLSGGARQAFEGCDSERWQSWVSRHTHSRPARDNGANASGKVAYGMCNSLVEALQRTFRRAIIRCCLKGIFVVGFIYIFGEFVLGLWLVVGGSGFVVGCEVALLTGLLPSGRKEDGWLFLERERGHKRIKCCK